MTKTSAIAIQIVTGDARPIFRQIVDGIRREIANGNLQHGSKLPSVRGLALQLMINANTVAKAYNELTAQGLLESRKGLGIFVAKNTQVLSDEERAQQLNEATERFINDVITLDYSPRELSEYVLAALAEFKAKD